MMLIFAPTKIVTSLWRTLVSILTNVTTVPSKITTPSSTVITVDEDMRWEIWVFDKVNFWLSQ